MKTRIGLMPFNQAEEDGIYLSRRVIFYPSKLIRAIGDHKVLLNINHYITQPYETDLDKYKRWLLSIDFSELNPRVIAIENEEQFPYDPPKSMEAYLDQLRVATETFPNHKIANGGFTFPIYYWYATQKPDDTEFFEKCLTESSQLALASGNCADKVAMAQMELDGLKSLPISFWNIHYYLRQAGEVEPHIRMINYVSEYLDKPPISTEAGIYTEGLLNDVISIARQTGMKFLILYSGGEFCLPISKEQFQEAVSQ